MADERDKEGFDAAKREDKTQATGGQQSHENEYGRQEAQPGQGAEPPRSMGTKGTEFGQMADHDRSGQQGQSGTGQADLGSQAGSTLSGHTDQQELGEAGGEIDQPGSVGGASGSATRGEGFILQGSGEDEEDEEGAGPKDVGSGGPGSAV